MNRRQLGAGISSFGAGLLTLRSAAAQSWGPEKRGAAIDQNTVRRRGVGLRGLDARRASAGWTLFAPMMGDGTVYLIDLDGKIVHTWRMPYPPGLYGYLTERGTLFYNGKIANQTFLGKAPFKGGAALEADWSGRILWEVRDGLSESRHALVCESERRALGRRYWFRQYRHSRPQHSPYRRHE